jgi:hypothetical protein
MVVKSNYAVIAARTVRDSRWTVDQASLTELELEAMGCDLQSFGFEKETWVYVKRSRWHGRQFFS